MGHVPPDLTMNPKHHVTVITPTVNDVTVIVRRWNALVTLDGQCVERIREGADFC